MLAWTFVYQNGCRDAFPVAILCFGVPLIFFVKNNQQRSNQITIILHSFGQRYSQFRNSVKKSFFYLKTVYNEFTFLPPPPPFLLKLAFSMLAFSVLLSGAFAQNDNCGLVPTAQDFNRTRQDLARLNLIPSTPLAAVIPVIFYVVVTDNGLPTNGASMTNAQADAVLAQLSTKFSVSPYSFTFQRCGNVNIIHNSSLQNGTMQAANFLHSPWAVNIIVDNSPGQATAEFPWTPGSSNNTIYFRGGYSLPSTTLTHEMGHSFGLLHTFGASVMPPYIIPANPTNPNGQLDHPYNIDPTAWPRELVIRQQDNSKTFKKPNHTYTLPDEYRGGDLLEDTPAGCNPNDQTAWPGCSFLANSTTCHYDGTYLDYNGMQINDPSDILVKNFMSYGNGICRQEFTLGQLDRMFDYWIDQRQGQFKPQWCGNLDDKVEFKGTNTGINRVAIEFSSPIGGVNNLITKIMTDPNGGFSGLLQPDQFGNFTVSANVSKLGANADFTFTDFLTSSNGGGEWLDGVTTFDLVQIRKHILGLAFLDGYNQIAADVNNSGSVTTTDQVIMTKLILMQIPTFSDFTQPWRFIRESITLNNATEFDGIGIDNPFQFPNLSGTIPYQMTTGKQGFDAVKLGDLNESNSEGNFGGQNPPNIGSPLYVNITKQVVNGKSNYEFKVDGFENIVAYQMDIEFPAGSLQYSAAQPMNLAGVNEDFFGKAKLSEGLLKTLWFDEVNANAVTLSNGSGIFKLVFNGSTGQATGDLHLAKNIGYRANDSQNQLRSFAYEPDGTIRPIIERQYHQGVVAAVSAYPNPFSNSIAIPVEAVQDGTIEVQLFNSIGQILHQSKQPLSKGSNNLELNNLEHLSDGIYFVQINSGGDSITKKLLKKG